MFIAREQVDLIHGRFHVHRLKNGMPSVHPLAGTELGALRRLQREQKPGRHVFMSERGAPMSAAAFRRMVTRLGPAAKMPFGIHPHMLRHSTGFNSGSIAGGLSGDGVTRADAIMFTGGTNTLELRLGSTITGNVVAFSAARDADR